MAGRLDPGTWGRGLELFALALLGYGLYRNLHLRSLWLIVAGFASNTLMILLYGGQMPVTAGAMKAAGLGRFIPLVARRGDGLHVLARPNDPLWWLGDAIPLRYQVISVGDLLITLGLALAVLELGLRAKARRIGAVKEHG